MKTMNEQDKNQMLQAIINEGGKLSGKDLGDTYGRYKDNYCTDCGGGQRSRSAH